jgi:hypothetical protein
MRHVTYSATPWGAATERAIYERHNPPPGEPPPSPSGFSLPASPPQRRRTTPAIEEPTAA